MLVRIDNRFPTLCAKALQTVLEDLEPDDPLKVQCRSRIFLHPQENIPLTS